jgi:4-hydroxy-tetrahydrodipicolinate reductase
VAARRYRIAQWGTGNVGLHALRAVIQHPQMALVGLRVYSEAKEGQDAGDLCGVAPTGVLATRSIEPILAALPDCVLYMPDHVDADDMCRLLEAGVNIATACIGFNHRDSIEPGLRARLEAACAKGGASLYSTGSSPGWSTEIMPYALLAMQRRLDCLTITDYADMASRNSPEMIFNFLGFGADPAKVDPNRPVGTAASTPPTFRAVADAIGLPLDDVATSIEYAVTKKRETIAAGTLEAGTIGAMRMGVIGLREGQPIIRRFSTWYVARDLDPAWDLRDSGWRIEVQGDTSLDVSIAFDVAPEDYASYSPGLTAHPVVNAVPYVCDAAPGILETADLPPIIPYLGP